MRAIPPPSRLLLAAFPRFADIIYNRRRDARAAAETVYSWPVTGAGVTKFENSGVLVAFALQIARQRRSPRGELRTVSRDGFAAHLKLIGVMDGGLSLVIRELEGRNTRTLFSLRSR